MKTKGILITVNDNYKPNLSEIIQEINNGDSLHWSILYLWVIGSLGDQIDEDEINTSKKGVLISWSDLILASKSQSQIIDLLLIGCSDMDLIHRYESDQDMYEACDISIGLIDGGCWEIFSKDKNLIDRLAGRFENIDLLESDFQNYINLGDSANRRRAVQRPQLVDIDNWRNLGGNKTGSLYDYIPFSLKKVSPDVCFAFCELFWPTFMVHQSHVFLSESFSEERFKLLSKENENIEYRMNFIAIDPYFMYEESRYKRAEFIGRSIAEAWHEKLKHDFPKLQFNVEYRLDLETKNYGVSFYQKN